jgi:hypothetical protein
VSYDDGIEPRTVATLLLAVRRSTWWAKNTSKFQEEEKVPILRHTGRIIASGSGTDPDPREFESQNLDYVPEYPGLFFPSLAVKNMNNWKRFRNVCSLHWYGLLQEEESKIVMGEVSCLLSVLNKNI